MAAEYLLVRVISCVYGGKCSPFLCRLSYGCLLLLCGRLADIIGSKRMFLIGSLWFSVWSIAAAFAKSPVAFIIFLGLQGMGSGE